MQKLYKQPKHFTPFMTLSTCTMLGSVIFEATVAKDISSLLLTCKMNKTFDIKTTFV